MARAKRTDRAEARRRARAERGLAEEAASEPAAIPTQPAAASTAASTARPSVSQAFRQAFRPVDVRSDLQALPWIAIHTKALWLPILLTVATTLVFYVTRGADIVSQFMFAYFVQTPAIGGVFLAGFLAPRASWLLGVIVGLVSAICYSALVLTIPAPAADASGTVAQPQEVILAAFVLSPIMGAIFASAAAWYRRFLNLTNPNRGRQSARQGADGRTRKAAPTKADARR